MNHISLEGHGREPIDDTLDVSSTLGWFTTMYPVRLQAYDSISETIIQTKENIRTIPNKGIGFGALSQIGALTHKLPGISFNYLGQLDNTSSNSNSWQIINEYSGKSLSEKNQLDLLLNINGAIIQGQLQFDIGSQLSNELTTIFNASLKAGF